MAKKRKKKNQIGLILLVVASLFGIASLSMIFLPAFVGTDTIIGKAETSYKGIETVFGLKEEGLLGKEIEVLAVNMLSLLGYLLPLIALGVSLLFNKSGLFTLLSAITYLAGAVCSFLAVTTFPETLLINTSLIEWKMGIGTILNGSLSALAGLTLVIKKLSK